MKLTLQQIDQAYAACLKIKDEKLSIKTAYKLLKLANSLEEEIKNFEKFVQDILLEYCEKDENGEPILNETTQGEGVNIPLENRNLVQEKIQELNTTEVDFKDYDFNINDFEELTVSISELNGLLPFIKD